MQPGWRVYVKIAEDFGSVLRVLKEEGFRDRYRVELDSGESLTCEFSDIYRVGAVEQEHGRGADDCSWLFEEKS